MNKINLNKRIIYTVLGILILSLGAAILIVGNAGLDPYTAVNLSVGVNTLHLSLGIYQLAFNLVLLIIVFFLKRELIGIGTILNMIFVGFLIDFFTACYHQLFNINITLPIQLLFLIIGVLIFTLGASLYMSPRLGNSPYDAIAPIIVSKTNLNYRNIRIFIDTSFVIIAVLFGGFTQGYVGLGTIINAFFTGPLIVFWNKYSYQLVWKKSESDVTKLLEE